MVGAAGHVAGSPGGRTARAAAQHGTRRLGLAAVALAVAQLTVSCVDGVTPDCSDAAVCAPSAGEIPSDGSVNLREASADTGSAPGDAGLDADGG